MIVTGNRPQVSSQVVAAIAAEFNLDVDQLTIHRSSPEDFLLVLPNEQTAKLVVNHGRPVHTLRFSFTVKP